MWELVLLLSEARWKMLLPATRSHESWHYFYATSCFLVNYSMSDQLNYSKHSIFLFLFFKLSYLKGEKSWKSFNRKKQKLNSLLWWILVQWLYRTEVKLELQAHFPFFILLQYLVTSLVSFVCLNMIRWELQIPCAPHWFWCSNYCSDVILLTKNVLGNSSRESFLSNWKQNLHRHQSCSIFN